MVDRQFNITINVDADGAVTEVEGLERAFNEGLIDGMRDAQRETEKTESGFSKLQAGIVALNQAIDLGTRIISGAVSAFQTLSGALEEAARIEQITASFDRFQEKLGRDSVEAMEALRAATGGLVSDLELLDLANTSAALGIDQGTDQFLELVDAAQKASIALGKDFGEAVAVINQGIGRLSPQILDNLGVTLKLGEVYDDFAASIDTTSEALTEQEKKQALLNATLKQLQSKFGDTSKEVSSAGKAIGQITKAFENLRKEFLLTVSSNENLRKGLLDLADALADVNVEAVAKAFTDFAGRLARIAGVVAPVVVGAFNTIAIAVDKIDEAVINTFESLIPFYRTLEGGIKLAESLGFSLESAASGFSGVAEASAEALIGVEKLLSDIDKLTISELLFGKATGEATKGIEVQSKASKDKATETKVLNKELKELSDLELLVANGALSASDAIDQLLGSAEGGAGAGESLSGLAGILADTFDFEQEAATIGAEFLQSIGDAIGQGAQDGFGRDTAKAIGDSIANAAIQSGNPYAVAGGVAYKVFGEQIIDGIADAIGGKSDAQANAREAFEGFLIDAFDAQNASSVIDGELVKLKDLVNFDRDFFDSDENGRGFSVFNSLGEQAREAFQGVGFALSELIGDPENLGAQFAAELATGFEGNLFALKGAIDALGFSFQEMSDAIVDSVKKGEISFLQAQSALQGLGTLAEDGIPGQIGAVTEAFEAMKIAGATGGATTIQALKAVGAEAIELGAETIPQLQEALLSSGVAAVDVAQLMEALAEAGITSVSDLANATDSKLIQILADLESQAFAFGEGFVNSAQSVIDQLENIPEEINSRIVIDVETRASDSTAQQVIDSGILGESLRG